MNLLVSIIIPCYNAEAYVAEAIESALGQTWPHKEVIVVDDGSTDRSAEIIRNFGDRIHFVSLPHSGAPTARNEGIRRARGAYLKFLDADDVLLPEAVSWQVSEILSLPEKAIPYGQVLDFESKQPVFDKIRTTQATTPDDMLLACFCGDILITAPLYRVDALRAVNGFDPELKRSQEWDLHLRLALQGVIFCFVEKPVSLYRQHAGEHRITNRVKGSFAADHRRRVNLKAITLIQQHYGERIPPRTREEMYLRLYSLGRSYARHGQRTEAERLFEQAKTLEVKTPRIGRVPYRCLRRVVGDYWAVKIQSLAGR